MRNAHRLRAGRPNWDCMDAQGQQRRNYPPDLLNAADVGRNGQGCLLRAARDGLQDLPEKTRRAIRERLVQYRDVLR